MALADPESIAATPENRAVDSMDVESKVTLEPAPAAQPAAPARKRPPPGNRLFGQLLQGTLKRAQQDLSKKSDAEKKREEVDKKLREKLEKEKEEMTERVKRDEERKREKLEREKVAEEERRKNSMILRVRHLSNYLETNPSASPDGTTILYLPARHNDTTRELLKKRKRDADEKVAEIRERFKKTEVEKRSSKRDGAEKGTTADEPAAMEEDKTVSPAPLETTEKVKDVDMDAGQPAAASDAQQKEKDDAAPPKKAEAEATASGEKKTGDGDADMETEAAAAEEPEPERTEEEDLPLQNNGDDDEAVEY